MIHTDAIKHNVHARKKYRRLMFEDKAKEFPRKTKTPF